MKDETAVLCEFVSHVQVAIGHCALAEIQPSSVIRIAIQNLPNLSTVASRAVLSTVLATTILRCRPRAFERDDLSNLFAIPFEYSDVRQELRTLANLWSEKEKGTKATHTRTNSRISPALLFIDENYTNPDLRLRDVAHHIGTSPWHLSRLLREFTGLGFVAHLRMARLREVERLLAKTALSVKEVAGATGFKRVSDLDHYFRLRNGLTPTRWREVARSSLMPRSQ